jgi:hypothetical protein
MKLQLRRTLQRLYLLLAFLITTNQEMILFSKILSR